MVDLRDLGKGVKVGAIVGAWGGGLYSVFFTFTILRYLPIFARIPFILITLVRSIIGGIIFGIIFSLIYYKIPLKNSIQKGLLFYFGFSLIIFLLISYLAPGLYYTLYYNQYLPSLKYVYLVVPLIEGLIAGYMWDKFSKKDKKSSPN